MVPTYESINIYALNGAMVVCGGMMLCYDVELWVLSQRAVCLVNLVVLDFSHPAHNTKRE